MWELNKVPNLRSLSFLILEGRHCQFFKQSIGPSELYVGLRSFHFQPVQPQPQARQSYVKPPRVGGGFLFLNHCWENDPF